MKRKFVGLVLFCLILFAAIVAGYWDMLSTEKLKVVRDKASNAVGEIADIVRDDPAPEPAAGETAAAPAAADAQPPASPSSAGEGAETTGAEPADATASPQTGEETSAEAVAPPTPASPEASESSAAALPPPTFDILRVEPDGSTVLAGRAPAGAAVSLIDGTTTVGSEKANAAGDFVVVLDERLSVGDHQIKIEAKLPDGRSVVSSETAIVSIPEAGREADLLAMVETPDQASRLISIPAARPGEATDAAADEAGAAGAGTGAGEDIAGLPNAPAPSGDLLLPGASEPAAAPSDVPLPGAGPSAAFSVPPSTGAKASATLLVEAVEIENDTVYVAGRSTGGASVRVYIDNAFLAEDRRPAEGRFLVSAKAPVATGDHTVRADALDAAGAVLARVEVPFYKPEGEAMSAISPDDAAPNTALSGSGPSTAGAGADDLASSPAGVPPAEMTTPADPAGVADGVSPPPADAGPAGAPSASTIAEAPTEDAPPPASPEEALADRMAAAEPATTPPVSDPVTAAPTLSDTPAADAGTASAEPVEPAVPTAGAEPSSQAASVDSDRFGAAETPPSDPTTAESGADIAVTRQPALQGAPSRVIIRRGDTLWRISRETYGLGRRYTVIYLANGDQIRNPDRIYPGQVFRVPKDDAADAGASRVQ